MTSLFIEIPRRNSSCVSCKEPFSPNKDYYTCVENSDEMKSLFRKDYCKNCWSKAEQENTYSQWNGTIPLIKKETPLSTHDKDERLLEELRELLTKDDEESQIEAFILALYLARKRQIYLRKELEGKIFIYEIPSTREMLSVKKKNLSKPQIEKAALSRDL